MSLHKLRPEFSEFEIIFCGEDPAPVMRFILDKRKTTRVDLVLVVDGSNYVVKWNCLHIGKGDYLAWDPRTNEFSTLCQEQFVKYFQ